MYMYVYIYMWMCICICMYMHVQSCTYVKKINLYCICKCVYMEMSTYAHICTLYKYVYLCMYMFACVHVYLPVFLHLGSLTESYSVYSKPFVVSRCQSWYNDAQYVYIYMYHAHSHEHTWTHCLQTKKRICVFEAQISRRQRATPGCAAMGVFVDSFTLCGMLD